jgi:hypothetical protein
MQFKERRGASQQGASRRPASMLDDDLTAPARMPVVKSIG